MSITLTLTANTVEELREKAVAALGIDGLKLPRPFAEPDGPILREATKVMNDLEAAKRPVGRPRKTAKPDPAPDPDQEPVDEAPFEIDIGGMPSPDQHEDEPEYVEVPVPNSKADPVAMEKLKQETVAKLPDMFAAGKVNLMRAVLTKYGKGAKSFPEIEAKDFPEIAAALARGDGS